jgi:hypothetical protein
MIPRSGITKQTLKDPDVRMLLPKPVSLHSVHRGIVTSGADILNLVGGNPGRLRVFGQVSNMRGIVSKGTI